VCGVRCAHAVARFGAKMQYAVSVTADNTVSEMHQASMVRSVRNAHGVQSCALCSGQCAVCRCAGHAIIRILAVDGVQAFFR
jgi:hypothetical protein